MLKGNKYMLRTDVMYRRMEPAALAQFDAEQRAALWSQDPALLHLRPKELAPRIAARLGLAVGDRKPKAVIEEAMRQLSLSPPATPPLSHSLSATLSLPVSKGKIVSPSICFPRAHHFQSPLHFVLGVAAGLVLGVVMPDMVHFAGVAPIMIRLAKTGEVVTLVCFS